MNDSTITKLNLIAQLCEKLWAQSGVGTPARAAYQTTIDQCTMLTAALNVHTDNSPATTIARLELNFRTNILISVWSGLITQPT
jgi:hypothetical protein